MRVIVCGGRAFDDHELFHTGMAQWIERRGWPTEIVSGGATGADALGQQWATENGVRVRQFPADWRQFGKAAGPRRNAEMAAHVGVLGGCLAYPGGKGTRDMLEQARKRGLITTEVIPMKPIILLTKNACPDCERLKLMLDKPLKRAFDEQIRQVHEVFDGPEFDQLVSEYGILKAPALIDTATGRVLRNTSSLGEVKDFLSGIQRGDW